MTLDDVNKLDAQVYNEMRNERATKQAELEAYYKGYEQGIDRTIRNLRNHIINNEKGGDSSV